MTLNTLKKVNAMLKDIEEHRDCPEEIRTRKKIAIAAIDLFLKKQTMAAYNYMQERVELYRSSVAAWEKTPAFLRARIQEVFPW